jgi:hypothetical protein
MHDLRVADELSEHLAELVGAAPELVELSVKRTPPPIQNT